MRWFMVMALFLGACGAADEKSEDPDGRRDRAKPIAMNKVLSDSLTWDVDVSDWKLIYVKEPGLIFVKVHFDRPNGKCEVYLRDKYGAQMAREVQSNNPYIELVRKVEDPGRVFVWLHSPTSKCDTGYALEARIEPS